MQEDLEKSSQPAPEITPVQGGGEQVGSELDSVRDKLKGVRKEKESLQSELAAARNELKKVREGRGAFQSELAAARNELKGVRKEKEALQSVLDTVRDELKGVREEKESLQSELDAVRDELKGGQEEKEALQSELKKIRAIKVAELQKTRDVVIDPKHVASVLQPMLRHFSPDVRRAAVDAAGALGSPLLVFSLIQRLDDPVEEIRNAALAAVRAIAGQRVIDKLPEDEFARRNLLRTLRRCWTESGGLKLRLKQG